MRIAARKVAAGGADVGHEQGVAYQDQLIVDQVGHVRRGVAGNVQGLGLQTADMEDFIRGNRWAKCETSTRNSGSRLNKCLNTCCTLQMAWPMAILPPNTRRR